MKNKLIITGHDLGFYKTINEGFAYLLTKLPKTLSEISLLPNGLASEDAIALVRKQDIPVNLSFCLTNSKFKALSGVSSLTDAQGNLRNADTKTWNFSVVESFNSADIERELGAQYEWFVDRMGRKPSALVAQKGEYGDPKILEPFVKLAKQENLPARAPLWNWKANYGAQSFVEAEGIKTTQSIFMGMRDWRGEFGYDLETELDKLIVDIKKTTGVAELLLFIGFSDAAMFNMSSISWQRGQILNIVKRKYSIIERLYEEFDIVGYKDI
ncbi:ChbG/HpnK family deacetylase [bacterium]|nr:ChbG/HpnK family deacetylase [bacterium]